MMQRTECRVVPTQVVKITAKMQMDLKILHASQLELAAVIAQELLDNPAFDPDSDAATDDGREGARVTTTAPKDGGAGDEWEPDTRREMTVDTTRAHGFEATDWRDYLDNYAPDAHGPASYRQERTAAHDRQLQNLPAPSRSLPAHLTEQLRVSRLTAEECGVGALIIGNIDDRGYLEVPVEEIAFESRQDCEVVERVLGTIQTFDPPGVGARDLRECLLLQLSVRGAADHLAARIVRDHLDLLGSKRYGKLAEQLGVPVEDVIEAAADIAALEPKPGRNFGEIDIRFVVPDLFVERINGDWGVTLNDDALPRLRLSDTYGRLFAVAGRGQTKTYMKQRLTKARWLLSSIEFRNRTLCQVMDSILDRQRAFFEHGVTHLKPLLQRHVAADIGKHEATVSRATADKYVRTPHGTFPLKFFFPSTVPGANGEAVPSKRAQERIRALINREDPHHPLSDEQITTILRQEQIHLARRTVAKYREALRIAPHRMRRRADARSV